jgi:hypothetical protein
MKHNRHLKGKSSPSSGQRAKRIGHRAGHFSLDGQVQRDEVSAAEKSPDKKRLAENALVMPRSKIVSGMC